VLDELGLAEHVLLWNVVPTHPGTPTSNRPPSRAEVAEARRFLSAVTRGREIVAVGRLAAAVTGAPSVRHPSHGGARAFGAGLGALTRARTPVSVSL
jgi:uracil DNA glycosylase superfamily protein